MIISQANWCSTGDARTRTRAADSLEGNMGDSWDQRGSLPWKAARNPMAPSVREVLSGL